MQSGGRHIILSDIAATFAKDSSHLGKQDPYLDLEYNGKVYKTTMVKNGGVAVKWSQPVLLDDAATGAGILKVVAKAHKALFADKTLGEGSINLHEAASTQGTTTVPLRSMLGANAHAGQVVFTVVFGSDAAAAAAPQGQQQGNVVENVGGVGENIESGVGPGGPGIAGAGVAGGPGGGFVGGPGAAGGPGMAGPGGAARDVGGAPGITGPGTAGGGVGGPGIAGGAGGPQGGGFGGPGFAGGAPAGAEVYPGQAGVTEGVGTASTPGSGGIANSTFGAGDPAGNTGFNQGGGPGAGGYPNQQGGIVPGGGQGAVQQGGAGFQQPQQIHETHNHSVHDHQESETKETRRFNV